MWYHLSVMKNQAFLAANGETKVRAGHVIGENHDENVCVIVHEIFPDADVLVIKAKWGEYIKFYGGGLVKKLQVLFGDFLYREGDEILTDFQLD